MTHDLHHHGDKDVARGLVDFAVNVRGSAPPTWLRDAIVSELDWASYPDPTPARDAIAARHDVDPGMVLPTAGGAEAFTLLARAVAGTATVVHPQFTEPEAALRTAGREVARHLLSAETGFRLTPVEPADLVVVGNPTNPTSVLHPAHDLLNIPAGVLVVDEAFMDLVPGETESVISPQMPGRLVVRSLTKTWSLAGIRAGYVVGDPDLVAALKAHQPPWSVSSPAIAAMVATSGERARAETAAMADAVAGERADLVARLQALGLSVVTPAAAPFVLIDTRPAGAGSLRVALAERGYAVRRGESFPGLGPAWLRLAVRTAAQHEGLASMIATLLPPD